MSTTYLNATGHVLSETESYTKGFLANAKSILLGTTGNDGLRTGGSSTLSGGLGDDTYFVYTQKDLVVEKNNQGTDTIVSTANYYVLPDFVENLTLAGVNSSGLGNSLDNIIRSTGTGNQTLNGGAGNDVLIGGVGRDTFVAVQGDGSDVILNFNTANDKVQLNNYLTLNSFAKVQSAMTQVGADTVIKLEGGETLTLRDHKVADFTAANFALPLDLSKFALTFSDDFNSFSGSATGKSTTWMTKFPTNGTGARTLPTNHEDQYYSDSSVGVNPFSIKDGVLDITAAHATPGIETPAGSGLDWTSGLITTYKSFSQLYGYFEVRAELPAGQGFWPAFWLLPADLSWPPELDVFEVLGNDPGTVYASTHSKIGGPNVTNTQIVTGIDTSKGFHTYGVNWQADTITYYIDNNAVAKVATPSDMKKPMYMLLNLAVGDKGSWPGATDASTPNEGHMLIDYVHAYAAKPNAVVVPTPPKMDAVTAPVSAPPVVAPTLGVASLTKGTGAVATASLTGTAAAGASVTIYDGATLLATAGADYKSGAFSLSLKDLAAGNHVLSAKVGSTNVSADVVVVVETAANIATQLPTLQASGKVAAIYLIDSHVIPVASVAAMTNLISGSKDALAAIRDGYSFAVTNATTMSKSVANYDGAGKLTSKITSDLLNGKVVRSVESSADGSNATLVYTNGFVTSETLLHADKTKDVQLSNIVGQTYTAEHDSYDATGTLISTIRSHGDGSKAWEYTLNKQTNVKTTSSYDASGAITAQTVTSPTESVEKKYVGTLLTSEYTSYTAGSADIASLKTYTNGALTRETVRHSDQTSENSVYNIEGKSYVAKHDTLDASGKTTITDLTNKDGSHSVAGFKAGLSLESNANSPDTLKGLGSDTFVFQKHSGMDTIVGFHSGSGVGHDVIEIDDSVAATIAQLSFTTVGHDTVIHLTATDTITLQGVSQAALSHDNFWFH
ncbi:family 16 glycosylhydrolase [Methylobacterium sp. BTF04]|uniref:family 16 glycosylhydrolase n=1 Tax=Methylobacterium sp. BTF04 TaxID=2708300 RepID=UPI0013D4E9F9|nr:family 16 glycosylhydrolase [Methylobacterium sp. BTF04]NEU14471.1 family 16 glycosylhydrolase [Methylobacterium sp. BTF04]